MDLKVCVTAIGTYTELLSFVTSEWSHEMTSLCQYENEWKDTLHKSRKWM